MIQLHRKHLREYIKKRRQLKKLPIFRWFISAVRMQAILKIMFQTPGNTDRFAVDNNALPLTPHLLYPQFMNDETERDKAGLINYVLLGKCSELWVFGGVVSKGMAYEICVARKRKMKIRWFNHAMEEVCEYA